MDNTNFEMMEKLPVIPLRNIVIYPQMVTHFDVGRDVSIKAIEEAELNDSRIMLVTQKDYREMDPTEDDIYHVGTIAVIRQMLKLPQGLIRVLVEGKSRAEIKSFESTEPYISANVLPIVDDKSDLTVAEEAALRLVREDLETYINNNSKISPVAMDMLNEITSSDNLIDMVASYLPLKIEDSQRLLEITDRYDRIEEFHTILQREIELLGIENEINQGVKKQMGKVQKEYYLREQLKAIHKELGEEDEFEYGVIVSYLDWIIDLPWKYKKGKDIDLNHARSVLDEDHYGLKDVKERILEFLAVRKLTATPKGPILCLVGPPGVGKTSIARSISRALDKKFVRMSLGGVRDEAEIRGHRRTYVGSMPGQIIGSMKKAGSVDPVFLFDEIDKIGSDFRGDPASGLLEVLDPEQNATFTDHYLDVPYDLSKVFFITTANDTQTIPRPLLDRMEIIRIEGYTPDEKLQIAIKYLLPKQLSENGIPEGNISVSDNAIKSIINYYTREAGVRSLEREIQKIIRKAAIQIVGEKKERIRITEGNIEKYLGPKRFLFDELEDRDQVGVVNGLAWTQVGGTTLSVEVNTLKGNGKVQLTGQLGDVMKESAATGISYIRSVATKYGIAEDFYQNTDIHVHVPEGAMPKDGPSAGITIATAVLSALSGKAVRRDVAMTGEITLRGRVLPIGGLKEKLLAAERMGVTTVIIPKENARDLVEIEENALKRLTIIPVENVEEVFEIALISDKDED